MPTPLSKQSKELIGKLIAYFERERNQGGPLKPFTAVRERVADALGLNISTVSSISVALKANKPLTSVKIPQHKKLVRNVDDFTKVAVRNTMYRLHQERKDITVKILIQEMQNANIYEGGKTTLGKILQDIGLHYKKDNPRRGLMELPHIALKRVDFLQKYHGNKVLQNPNQFVFLDETWIFQNGMTTRSWQDNDVRSVRNMKSKGRRYIILHAGNMKGFIAAASEIFATGKNNTDYHSEMNHKSFMEWFVEKLLENLEQPSIIVMDNASYHSRLIDPGHNSSWKKTGIQQWLRDKNVRFDDGCLKLQLLDIVKRNKPEKRYMADEMAESYGPSVVRLPPYHCIFNPIEHIWGITKQYYNRHMGRDGHGVEKALSMWQEYMVIGKSVV